VRIPAQGRRIQGSQIRLQRGRDPGVLLQTQGTRSHDSPEQENIQDRTAAARYRLYPGSGINITTRYSVHTKTCEPARQQRQKTARGKHSSQHITLITD